MADDTSEMSYVILTHTVPESPYALGGGYLLSPIRPSSQTFEDWGDDLSDVYEVSMALSYINRSSARVYRDLVMFHSFICYKSDTYELAEKYQYLIQENSQLDFINDPDYFYHKWESNLGPIRGFKRFDGVDFDHFPLVIFLDSQLIIPSTPPPPLTPEQEKTLRETGMLVTDMDTRREDINYRTAFALFSRLKSSEEASDRRLYNQICLYVFAKSIEEHQEIYHNDMAVIAFYVAILHSIAGDPPSCGGKAKCIECGKTISSPHYTTTREQHLIDTLGYGFAEQTKIRNAFFHGGEFIDYSDAMFEIHDRLYIHGDRSEEALMEEKEIFELKEEVGKLGNTVRKWLIEKFIERYKEDLAEAK
ncbi:MAG: hypothetical protein WCA51_02925 [Dehalococcoidia bacterium]